MPAGRGCRGGFRPALCRAAAGEAPVWGFLPSGRPVGAGRPRREGLGSPAGAVGAEVRGRGVGVDEREGGWRSWEEGAVSGRRRGKGIQVQEFVFVAIPFQQRAASKRESHTSAGQET